MLGSLWSLLLLLGAAVGLVLLLVVVAGGVSVLGMSRATLLRLDADAGQQVLAKALPRVTSAFIAREGFEWVGAFVLRGWTASPPIAAWAHPAGRLYLCVYLLPNGTSHLDFVTILGDQLGVTTGTSRDGQLLPQRPGSYIQTFSDLTVPQLYTRHLQAEQYLSQRLGVAPDPRRIDFAVELLSAVRQQMSHVRSLALWPLRMPWWYFVRRHRLHERSVIEQVQAQQGPDARG